MKTAISIPDRVFKQAEILAQEMHLSRSALYSSALADFIEAHRQGKLTQKLNAIYQHEDSSVDKQLSAAQAKVLPEEEW